ncbi:MAG: CDP-alcohol phosphatidyltransferase family protein [Polyangiaceae bacterium]
MSWIDWLTGHMSSATRIVTSAAPAVALVVFVLVGLVAYAIRNRLVGGFHDEEMDGRGMGGLTTRRMRHFFAWLMRPFWRVLVVVGIPPNAITTLSVALALGAGAALAAGRFALGGWLYVAAGALDFLDGRVARETKRASAGGAALDSILDRYCESAVLVGLSWYYRDSWVLGACLLALTGSLFVPYVRARGESLGAKMSDVGLFQRPERILVLGITVALSPIPEAILAPLDPAPPHRLAMVGIVVIAVASQATAIQRMSHLLRALGTQAPAAAPLSTSRPPPPRPAVLAIPAPTAAFDARAPSWKMVLATVVFATAVDYMAVHLQVELLGISAPVATMSGCLAGTLCAFAAWLLLGRPPTSQGLSWLRHGFVSTTTVLLNGGGVAVVMLHPEVNYHVAWVVVRAVVFGTWNYPLLRDVMSGEPARA